MIGASTPAATAPYTPDEAGKNKLMHDLGGPFLVFRDQVQEELKLTQEQKEKLEQHLRELLPDAMRFFQKVDGLPRENRKQELAAYRAKAQQQLAAVLQDILNQGQCTRLHQMELQREGLFGSGETWHDLQVTDAQRQQFVAAIRQMQNKIEPLLAEAQHGGSPGAIRPQVMKLRLDLEAQLEALLTDTQKQQWKAMLGQPVGLDALFGTQSN